MTYTISQLEGMSETICVLHVKTLEEAKYHLKLIFNVTNEFYQHSTLTPIYGNGQRSTNSPTAWLFVSNIIFKCYQKHAHGASYQDPENCNKIHLYLLGFVDDINLYNNLFYVNQNDTPNYYYNYTRIHNYLVTSFGQQVVNFSQGNVLTL